MDPHQVIAYPLATERSIRLLEAENKLVFVVNPHVTKVDIKQAVEQMFKVKVNTVRTLITSRGEKRAYVKLMPQFPAIDIATELGLM